MKRTLLTIMGGMVGVAGLVAVLYWWPSTQSWEQFFIQVEAWGPWVNIALIGFMVLHNVVPIPAELIAVTAGMASGFAMGVAVIWLGAMIGAVLAFWVARRYGRRWLGREASAKYLIKFEDIVAAGDWQGLLVMRLIPVVSFNLVNYGAGLAGVGWGSFLWTTAVGILPITVISVAAGAGLHMIYSGPLLIGLVAVFVALLAFKIWRSTHASA